MENRSHALMAGLFTLGLSAVLVAVVFWLENREREPRVPYTLVSRSSVSGLSAQAVVRYRGVDVGRVTAVRFDPENPQVILIDVAVSARTPVTDATFARLGSQGITGLTYVEIDDEGKTGRPVSTSWAAPARIEMRPSMLQEFGDAGQLLLARVNDIAERLNALLSEKNQASLSRTLVGVERLTNRLVVFQDKLNPTLDTLPELTRRTTRLVDESERLVKELENLSRDARSHGEAIERVGEGAERLGDAATDVSTQTVPNLNRLLGKLERASESLERALEVQTREPRSLLFGAPPPEAGPGEPGFKARSKGEGQ